MYYQRPLMFRIVESLFRHWLLFVATFGTIVVLLSIFVATRPKTYGTQVTVVLNSQSITNPLHDTSEVIDWNAIQETVDHFQTLVQTKEFVQSALNDPNAEVPIHLNQPLNLNSPDEVAALQKGISIAPLGQDSFQVGLTYTDPEDSVTILKALTNQFISRNAQEKAAFYTQQRTFISGQADEYSKQLSNAEDRLTQFKQNNVSHMPGQQDSTEQQYMTLNQQLQQYQIEMSEDQGQVSLYQKELAATPQTIVDSTVSTGSPLDNQLKNLETERELDLSIRGMKPDHPAIRTLDQQIASLRVQIDKENKSGNNFGGITSTERKPNPMYLSVANQLANLQISIEGLKAQIADTQKLIGQTAQGVSQIPEEERIEERLQRDYQFNSDTYNQLVRKLQDATMSEQLYLRQQKGMFRIYLTTPPQLSTSRSKLLILFAGGLLLALFVAAAFVVLSEAMDRSFRDPYDLQRTLGVPVLAMLPESPDLHVADSRTPALTGGNARRLSNGKPPGLLTGPTPVPASSTLTPIAASDDSEDQQQPSGNFGKPGYNSESSESMGEAA